MIRFTVCLDEETASVLDKIPKQDRSKWFRQIIRDNSDIPVKDDPVERGTPRKTVRETLWDPPEKGDFEEDDPKPVSVVKPERPRVQLTEKEKYDAIHKYDSVNQDDDEEEDEDEEDEDFEEDDNVEFGFGFGFGIKF